MKEKRERKGENRKHGRCQVWSLAVTICMFSLWNCCCADQESELLQRKYKNPSMKSHRTRTRRLCPNKFKSWCAGSTTHSICVSSCTSHKPSHSLLINDNVEKLYVLFVIRGYLGLTGVSIRASSRSDEAHPKTFTAPDCSSDGALSSWSQHETRSHNICVGDLQQT